MVEIEQASAPVVWRNRIVGYAEVPPRELLANPKNYRLHPTGQRAAVGGMLDELGWIGVAVVNRTTGLMVDGHLRVELALAEDAPSVPVVYVELSEAEEALALAALDQTTGLAATDRAKLEALLDEVRTDSGPLSDLLAEIATREHLFEQRAGDGGGVTPFADFAGDGTPAAVPFVDFRFGDYHGKVARVVYDTFISQYRAMQKSGDDLVLLDDVLRGWLGV
jgi:hypothetical protein